VRTWNTAVSATNLDQVFVLAERQKKHAAAKRSKRSIKAIEFAIGFHYMKRSRGSTIEYKVCTVVVTR
jgi:hypothetical protein